jgi:hypothetical protein
VRQRVPGDLVRQVYQDGWVSARSPSGDCGRHGVAARSWLEDPQQRRLAVRCLLRLSDLL